MACNACLCHGGISKRTPRAAWRLLNNRLPQLSWSTREAVNLEVGRSSLPSRKGCVVFASGAIAKTCAGCLNGWVVTCFARASDQLACARSRANERAQHVTTRRVASLRFAPPRRVERAPPRIELGTSRTRARTARDHPSRRIAPLGPAPPRRVERAAPRTELGTSRTLSENHATRPSSRGEQLRSELIGAHAAERAIRSRALARARASAHST